MMIVGLGDVGCNIADEFHKYNQYTVFKLNFSLKTDDF
jgi:hypothetical protein